MQSILTKIKQWLIVLHQWSLKHPTVTRVFHTAWQVAAAFFISGISAIHTAGDARALVMAAIAAGLSAGKNQAWPLVVSWAASEAQHVTIPEGAK